MTMRALLSFSLVGCCSSEALISSSTAFLPRSLSMRGGSEGTKIPQLRKSASTSAFLDLNSSEGQHTNGDGVNGDAASITVQIRKGRLNGVKNGVSRNGKRNSDDKYVDVAIPAEYIAETNLPTDYGHFRLRAYRCSKEDINENCGNEPCVIYAADKPPFGTDEQLREDVPFRVHDQCMTSEVFRSQRCDCKEQFNMALKYIHENGGAVVYMQQEGRGIGLANKVAAYSLQDDGLDTVDANLHLGFPEDARQYGAIPEILKDMRIGSIQLMTNNPRKVKRLALLGVRISGTVPMVVPSTNKFNHKYMEAKHSRMAHANLSPLFNKNGNMVPKKLNLAEDYIADAKSVHVSLTKSNGTMIDLTEELDMTGTESTEVESNEEQMDGVSAREDGYCFGRESVEKAIAAVKAGKMVVVVDDMDRENEGDFIMAAEACTPEDMATIVRYSSGVVCIGMEGKRMDELKLPSMVTNNEDPKGTAFSVTVDATKEHGITTGISAHDRSKTVNLLADPNMRAIDFARPGHIFPLRAKAGGVLERDGHTEAAVDLSILAGRGRAGILCEIVSEENPTEMARLPELQRFCRKHGYVLTSIVDIAQYRRELAGTKNEVGL